MSHRGQLGCVLLLAGIACVSPSNDGTGLAGPGAGALVPTPTPPGAPLALPVATATIPAAGGTLSSADGALTLTVPAGAVAVPTDFTIAAIGNTARGAVGSAFRLGPEGTTFTTPVTLTLAAPTSYPNGASIADVGVEYQDATGYWHRVEPVTRNAAANTLTVQARHFSDWAVTWQTGTPAAEGPITLVQTVGTPMTATGRATLFLQGDDASDTVYVMTGSLTLAEPSYTVNDAQCAPVQATLTLPFSVAEVHKSAPPVFRWGIGATWELACTAPGGAATTELLPALFDTMSINLTRCGGDYAAGQVVEADRLAGTYTKDCGVEGRVSATWDLRTCATGLPCALPDCRAGVTACDAATGVQSCVDAGTFVAAGTECGTGEVCTAAGACVACTDGTACPPANPCNATGAIACALGAVCLDGPFLGAGASCDAARSLYCAPSGACTCQAGVACGPLASDPCHLAETTCPGGIETCAAIATPNPGASCDPGQKLFCDVTGACACQAEQPCTLAAPDACHVGKTECTTGVAACVAEITPGASCDAARNLFCDPAGACTCEADVACDLPTPPDACHEGRTDCSSGVAVCVAKPKPGASCDAAQGLFCDASGGCTCAGGQACALETPDACHVGVTSCATGAAVCTPEVVAGASCGGAFYCDPSGACTCQADVLCGPLATDRCHEARTVCPGGVSTCAATPTALPPGTSCDAALDLFCDPTGSCTCQANALCALAMPDPCHEGKTECSSGDPLCASTQLPDGTLCTVDGGGQGVCLSGVCQL
ncbi:hypothetical protein [Anaeromyxobacter oryzae]|uniref:ZU5 domain-containing protein n=1 Tax=Anaeromyxobacter oryzae TaxID=2918170 RepID=A0ABM7X0C9_9BACT|nr:hypothetical protein [Anaeromyxobacter oryzae]BDG05251.1 hypothetical protein AMOR_42470 [Anaeromyxobacter oryzae]